jgi:stage III sporulation protein AD
MEQVFQVAALCVVGALLAAVVREGSPSLALLIPLGAAVVVLLWLAGPFGEVTAFLTELSRQSGVSQELLAPLYKTVGIALVAQLGGHLCRDAGGSALASVVETAGAVCALLVALPLLRAVVTLLLEFME